MSWYEYVPYTLTGCLLAFFRPHGKQIASEWLKVVTDSVTPLPPPTPVTVTATVTTTIGSKLLFLFPIVC
jgi:hypothetical protein